MGHVFISYSRNDQVYARRLTDDLRQHGFDVWIDDRIDYGDRWWQTIVAAIRACSAFVVVMSPDSEKSEWVEREILLAQRSQKPIFPLLLEGDELPLLITVQFADVRDGEMPPEDFYERLARVLVPKDATGEIVTPRTHEPTPMQKAQSGKAWWMGALVGVVALVLVGIVLLSGALDGDDDKDRDDANKDMGQPSEAVTDTTTQPSPESTETPSSTTTPTASPTQTPDPNSPATPNGGGAGEIAYTSYSYDEQDWGIYVMNADGSNPKNLTRNPSNYYGITWSPDGTQIAFGSTYEYGNSEIYLMNADGSNLKNLTQHEELDIQPAWSATDSKIAFSSFRDGNAEIYVMNADGSDPIRLMQNEVRDNQPAWSPDGSKIVFVSEREGNAEIYVMNADGSEPTRLTQNGAVDWDPAWSPDGTHIAFMSNRDGNDEIYIMNANGTEVMNLTQNTAHDYGPAWSPDGTLIAFVSDRDISWEIYVMNPDGTDQHNISNLPESDEADPAWRPALRQ
ncbi:MAG: hypothetical protein BroJett018_52970 [Chloroflexota bacterium]|nr:MAG: hypothetical protein BroJett018_52970 [Chloroflexota bacterium]